MDELITKLVQVATQLNLEGYNELRIIRCLKTEAPYEAYFRVEIGKRTSGFIAESAPTITYACQLLLQKLMGNLEKKTKSDEQHIAELQAKLSLEQTKLSEKKLLLTEYLLNPPKEIYDNITTRTDSD